MFLVDDRMWNVFLQTGNVEAYLLVKQIERTTSNDEKENQEEPSELQFEMKH